MLLDIKINFQDLFFFPFWNIGLLYAILPFYLCEAKKKKSERGKKKKLPLPKNSSSSRPIFLPSLKILSYKVVDTFPAGLSFGSSYIREIRTTFRLGRRAPHLGLWGRGPPSCLPLAVSLLLPGNLCAKEMCPPRCRVSFFPCPFIHTLANMTGIKCLKGPGPLPGRLKTFPRSILLTVDCVIVRGALTELGCAGWGHHLYVRRLFKVWGEYRTWRGTTSVYTVVLSPAKLSRGLEGEPAPWCFVITEISLCCYRIWAEREPSRLSISHV